LFDVDGFLAVVLLGVLSLRFVCFVFDFADDCVGFASDFDIRASEIFSLLFDACFAFLLGIVQYDSGALKRKCDTIFGAAAWNERALQVEILLIKVTRDVLFAAYDR
jgi:hypothetical protein